MIYPFGYNFTGNLSGPFAVTATIAKRPRARRASDTAHTGKTTAYGREVLRVLKGNAKARTVETRSADFRPYLQEVKYLLDTCMIAAVLNQEQGQSSQAM